jgi:putative transposase
LYEVVHIEKGESITDIGAYCLMPNHFHLLVRDKGRNGTSLFLQKLLTGYTMYFNKRYKRSGTLFEGRSKARHADKDAYLSYLFAYIHLNPVKLIDPKWKENGITNRKAAESFLATYRYSSFHDYARGKRLESKILCKSAFPEYTPNRSSFRTMIAGWLNYKDEIPALLQGRTL